MTFILILLLILFSPLWVPIAFGLIIAFIGAVIIYAFIAWVFILGAISAILN